MNESEGDYFYRFRGSPGMVDRISISVSGTINKNERENQNNQGQKEKVKVMKKLVKDGGIIIKVEKIVL